MRSRRCCVVDGFTFDEYNSIRPQWEVLTQPSIQCLPDESAIPGHIRRMWEAVEARPEQSISAAKDAIESAARHVLGVLGVAVPPKPKFPALVELVQTSLKLHPKTVAPDSKGAELVVGMLGSLANIANKIDEFRNLYGDGHGQADQGRWADASAQPVQVHRGGRLGFSRSVTDPADDDEMHTAVWRATREPRPASPIAANRWSPALNL